MANVETQLMGAFSLAASPQGVQEFVLAISEVSPSLAMQTPLSPRTRRAAHARWQGAGQTRGFTRAWLHPLPPVTANMGKGG